MAYYYGSKGGLGGGSLIRLHQIGICTIILSCKVSTQLKLCHRGKEEIIWKKKCKKIIVNLATCKISSLFWLYSNKQKSCRILVVNNFLPFFQIIFLFFSLVHLGWVWMDCGWWPCNSKIISVPLSKKNREKNRQIKPFFFLSPYPPPTNKTMLRCHSKRGKVSQPTYFDKLIGVLNLGDSHNMGLSSQVIIHLLWRIII